MKRLQYSIAILALVATIASAVDKPNILWITSEDNGISWVSPPFLITSHV